MVSINKGFNEAFDNVKKLEGVNQAYQAKLFSKRPKNVENFGRSYARVYGQQAYEVCPIQSAMTTSTVVPTKGSSQVKGVKVQGASYSSTDRISLKRGYFYCGKVGKFKRKCYLRQVNTQVQQ